MTCELGNSFLDGWAKFSERLELVSWEREDSNGQGVVRAFAVNRGLIQRF
jgi:hypothetical protein